MRRRPARPPAEIRPAAASAAAFLLVPLVVVAAYEAEADMTALLLASSTPALKSLLAGP
jgi:hypothetical protein